MLHVATLALTAQLWVLTLRRLLAVLLPLSVVVALEHLRHVLCYLALRIAARRGARSLDPSTHHPLPKESDGSSWPKVAIQLPMFNERLVCQPLIDCACSMDWPSHRLVVQVLDDSTDWATRQLVDDKVAEWRERGVHVEALRRTHRQGYKAGALHKGMESLQDCKYVAVFDADFRPEADFLRKTVPWLEGNAGAAFVQARWAFSNADESFLTKCQEISLNYHFKVEQYVHFAHGSFFNFNGTAGVWRTSAVASVGGWKSRTTVEDMDLSLRTYLAGYRAIFLEDVTCASELPSSLFAFRKQQHRWTTGPMQLLIKALPEIMRAPLPMRRKAELVGSFFVVGKATTHVVCLLFYCMLLPLSVFTPELQARIPLWSLLHVPVVMTLNTCMFTHRGWLHSITFVLFQNAIGIVKMWALVAGLLGLKHANEWVVTTKMGSGRKKGHHVAMEIPTRRIYVPELAYGCFMMLATTVGIVNRLHFGINVYMFFQGLAFLAFGLNLVDGGSHWGWLSTPHKESPALKGAIKINAVSSNSQAAHTT